MFKTFDPKQINQLKLLRHGWLSPEFELTDNVSSYGTLSYNFISRRTAMAVSATNKWTFSLGYPFTRTISIHDENGVLLGETKREIFSRRTILTLQSGFTAEFYRPFIFSREHIWESNGYGTILRIRGYPFLFKDVIDIEQTMTPPVLIPLLIFLGAHLTILRRRRRAAR
jgi:hypothetical protein